MARINGLQQRWSAAEVERLRTMWASGVQSKIIAHSLDRTLRSVEYKLVRMQKTDPEGWPKRYGVKHCGEKRQLTLYLNDSTLMLARRRARQRGSTVSAYLRYLIERDN